MRKTIISLLLMVAIALHSVAADDGTEIAYYLPLTAVRMSVLVEHSAFTPGELAAYSELYLKESAETESSEQYRIVGTSFSLTQLPDTSRCYSVAIDKKHSLISLSRDQSGVLKAINTQARQAEKPNRFVASKAQKQLNPHDYMSQEILNSGNPSTMARMVAQEIYDIRDSRTSLSRGEADYMPKDGDQLRMMMAQMDTQEKALLQAFTGSTTVDTVEYVVTFVPSPKVDRQMIFRFSKYFGLVDVDDLSGELVYAEAENLDIRPEMPEIPAEVKKQKDTLELYVVLPGKINLVITTGGEVIGRTEMFAAQYGTVETLPGALWGKKFTTRIVLDPATGAIDSLETEPLD